MELAVVDVDSRTHKVELRVGGEPVSWLYIHDLWMRVGSKPVLTGGIGGVYTKREYRMRGYARRVMIHAVSWMAERGYRLSALFGIPYFYHRFGFATFMGEHRLSILLRDAEEARCTHRLEEFNEDDPGHRRAVVEIYNENNRSRSGTILRTFEEWKGFKKGVSWEHKPYAYLLRNEDGEIVGYFARERWEFGDSMSVTEVGARGDDYGVFESIVCYAARMAREGRFSRIEFYVPSDHPFADFALRYGYTLRVECPQAAHGMARVVDLRKLFEDIAPVLEQRLRVSEPGYEAKIAIVSDVGEVGLRIGGGSVELLEECRGCSRVKVRQDVLTQLVLGYRSVREVAHGYLEAEPGALRALSVLFPRGVPYVWQADRW